MDHCLRDLYFYNGILAILSLLIGIMDHDPDHSSVSHWKNENEEGITFQKQIKRKTMNNAINTAKVIITSFIEKILQKFCNLIIIKID